MLSPVKMPMQDERGGAEAGRDTRPASLEVRDLRIGYQMRETRRFEIAVDGVDFSVKTQEFVCLVGPSGCGKSSILNAVAGLLRPVGGEIIVEGQPIAGPGKNRSVVFQSPALLPWRTALENVRYGLDLWGTSKSRGQ